MKEREKEREIIKADRLVENAHLKILSESVT